MAAYDVPFGFGLGGLKTALRPSHDMPHDPSISAQVDLALANAKRVQREARIVVQTLARLRDALDEADPGVGSSDTPTVHGGHKEP